jgi:uncharacterized protein (DUF1810 family)
MLDCDWSSDVCSSDLYARALAELRAGRKRSHWIWYVLPQLRGLGLSGMSKRYGIASLQEAREYLAHPLLGARLHECIAAIGEHHGTPIEQVLGDLDAMKYRSCLTLFGTADPADARFAQALARHFGGRADERTLERLAAGGDTTPP